MAFFCQQTGVRIAGPGIVDTCVPDSPYHAGMARYPAIVEVDGVEMTLAEAERIATDRAPVPAPPAARPAKGKEA